MLTRRQQHQCTSSTLWFCILIGQYSSDLSLSGFALQMRSSVWEVRGDRCVSDLFLSPAAIAEKIVNYVWCTWILNLLTELCLLHLPTNLLFEVLLVYWLLLTHLALNTAVLLILICTFLVAMVYNSCNIGTLILHYYEANATLWGNICIEVSYQHYLRHSII